MKIDIRMFSILYVFRMRWTHLGFDAISSFVHEFLVFSVLDRENNEN